MAGVRTTPSRLRASVHGDRTTFPRDIERDAVLVHASMRGLHIPAAIGLGLTPDEALVHHPAWLKAQGASYIHQVSRRVAEMEGEE